MPLIKFERHTLHTNNPLDEYRGYTYSLVIGRYCIHMEFIRDVR